MISNAIKFTKDGIIVINICESKDGNHAIVTVKDAETGIDPEIVPRLFHKFASRSFSGNRAGGLFISRSIIEGHGGKIWAENNPNGIGVHF